MSDLHRFGPPYGRLLLAEYGGDMVGIGCLKRIGPNIAELKRMYVRPVWRGRDIGRALLLDLIEEARKMGYASIRLDTPLCALAAHSLYAWAGFREIEPYPESEIPEESRSCSVFMELVLSQRPSGP